jgi:ribose-phosphate pyrophosphokinase
MIKVKQLTKDRVINIPFNVSKFPGGELHVVLDSETQEVNSLSNKTEYNIINITCRLTNSEELLTLLFLHNILKQYTDIFIIDVQYLPYARQDRYTDKFGAFSLETCIDILSTINSPNVKWIFHDLHSSVSKSLLSKKGFNYKLYSCSWEPLVYKYIQTLKPDSKVMVIPDKGATNQDNYNDIINKLSAEYNSEYSSEYDTIFNQYKHSTVEMRKFRDPITGKLSRFKIGYSTIDREDNSQKTFIICDDICDGGGTYLGIAQALKNKYGESIKLALFVTHGIFSKNAKEKLREAGFIHVEAVFDWVEG